MLATMAYHKNPRRHDGGSTYGFPPHPPQAALQDHSPAEAMMSEARHSIVAAILMRLSRVTLRSPRSILPMWDRSMAAPSVRTSCLTPRAFLWARMAWPSSLTSSGPLRRFLFRAFRRLYLSGQLERDLEEKT